jgi:cbb3-type cytochrome oxidase maturation protein
MRCVAGAVIAYPACPSAVEHAMSVLLYLVPAALGLGLIGLAAFLWSLRSGQYDDLDGAALRILGDDDVKS